MVSIAALLLAAGESTRMGELKALLPWHGTTLLEHQLSSLASAGVSLTIVVLGHQSERLEPLLRHRPDVKWVHNPQYRQGKTTSIKVGVHALREINQGFSGLGDKDAFLVLNVDQPRSIQTIRKIIELHLLADSNESNDQPKLITVPTYRGKGGHPIILSTSLIDEVLGISEDTMGVKALVKHHEKEAQRVEIDSPEVLVDLNTPEDYQRALEISASI